MAKCGFIYSHEAWKDRVDLMVTLTKGKGLHSTIRKLCLAVSVYYIWRERNLRLHDNTSRPASAVLHIILDTIRGRLLSIRDIHDSEENRAHLACWNI